MLHEVLAAYLDRVEHTILQCRYDSTPHFPDLPNFPHHKHLPNDVITSDQPDIEQVVQEAMQASG